MPARTVIVSPCFDEAARLDRDRFRGFVRSVPDVDFVLVDDGSRDGTRRLLESLAADHPERFRVVVLERNRGKAEAVRQGMLRAFEAGPAFAGYWDSDLATPLGEIPRFVEQLEKHPGQLIVLGARVKLFGRDIVRSELRHYAGRVFATFASMTVGLGVYDTQCGAKLFRNCPETRALFETPFVGGWTFDVEILARLVASRRRSGSGSVDGLLSELPLRTWREPGASKVRPLDFFTALRDLARIRRLYGR